MAHLREAPFGILDLVPFWSVDKDKDSNDNNAACDGLSSFHPCIQDFPSSAARAFPSLFFLGVTRSYAESESKKRLHLDWHVYASTHGGDGGRGEADAHRPHELMLIYDMSSQSWAPPLLRPRVFSTIYDLESQTYNWKSKSWPPGVSSTTQFYPRQLFPDIFLCSNYEGEVIIHSRELAGLLIFNPLSPPGKLLPPWTIIKTLKGLVLARKNTAQKHTNVKISDAKKEDANQDTVEVPAKPDARKAHTVKSDGKKYTDLPVEMKINSHTVLNELEVILVGETGDLAPYVVEIFDFIKGEWKVWGLIERQDEIAHEKMLYFKGCVYALGGEKILIFSASATGGLVWSYKKYPDNPKNKVLSERVLVASQHRIFLVGLVITSEIPCKIEDRDGLAIWEFHNQLRMLEAEDEHAVRWELLTLISRTSMGDRRGDSITSMDSYAHGNVIVVYIHRWQRLLMFDVILRKWKFTPEIASSYVLGPMQFAWEPLLRR